MQTESTTQQINRLAAMIMDEIRLLREAHVDHPLTAELISRSVLIRVTEDEWINPQHVIGVESRAKDSMTSADDPRVIVFTTNGSHVIRDRSLAEIVALINGDAGFDLPEAP